MMKVTGNDVPGAVGQSDSTLLPGLQVPWINGSGEIRQSFSSGAKGELGAWCLTRSSSH